MLIDGVKYACEACKRGHRVSECNHANRPLIVIPKKGRPPSQCPHCRSLRKSRAAHVKCVCGDKAKKLLEDAQIVNAPLVLERPAGCCCRVGEKCTCSLKKDHMLEDEISPPLDTIPEFIEGSSSSASMSPFHDSDEPTTVFRVPSKPALHTHKSDGSVHCVNGHHKPLHHHQHTGVHNYQPYNLNKPHGMQYHFSHSATKSVDSLPIAMKLALQPALEAHPLHESIRDAQQEVRLVRSAHNSPVLRPQAAGNSLLDDADWAPDWEFDLYSQSLNGVETGFDSYGSFTLADSQSLFSTTDGFAALGSVDTRGPWQTPWPKSQDEQPSLTRSSTRSYTQSPGMQENYSVDDFISLRNAEAEKALNPQQIALRPYHSFDMLPALTDEPASSSSSAQLSRVSSMRTKYATEVDEIDQFLRESLQQGKSRTPEVDDFAPGGYVIGF